MVFKPPDKAVYLTITVLGLLAIGWILCREERPARGGEKICIFTAGCTALGADYGEAGKVHLAILWQSAPPGKHMLFSGAREMAEHKIPTVGGGIAHLWYHTSDSIYLLTQDWNAGALGEFRFMLGHFDGARWRFKPLSDTPEKVTGKYYSKYENRWMLGPDGRLGALGRDEAKGTYVLEIFDGLKNEERFELSLGTERTILDCVWAESEGVVLAFASKDSVTLHKLDPFTGDMEQWRVVRLPPGSTEPTCGVDICEVGESFSIVVRPRPGPGDGRKCGAWTWDLSAKDSEDARWRGIPEEERVETLTSDAGRPHMIEDAAGDKLLAYSTGRKVVLCAMTDGGDWKIINECSFPDGGEVRVCGLRLDGAGDHVELLIYVGPPPFGGSRRKRAFIVRMPTNG